MFFLLLNLNEENGFCSDAHFQAPSTFPVTWTILFFFSSGKDGNVFLRSDSQELPRRRALLLDLDHPPRRTFRIFFFPLTN